MAGTGGFNVGGGKPTFLWAGKLARPLDPDRPMDHYGPIPDQTLMWVLDAGANTPRRRKRIPCASLMLVRLRYGMRHNKEARAFDHEPRQADVSAKQELARRATDAVGGAHVKGPGDEDLGLSFVRSATAEQEWLASKSVLAIGYKRKKRIAARVAPEGGKKRG